MPCSPADSPAGDSAGEILLRENLVWPNRRIRRRSFSRETSVCQNGRFRRRISPGRLPFAEMGDSAGEIPFSGRIREIPQEKQSVEDDMAGEKIRCASARNTC